MGKFAEEFALVTHPYLAAVVTVGLALHAFGQRQRRLALALLVAALGVAVWDLQRAVYPRDRPVSSFVDFGRGVG